MNIRLTEGSISCPLQRTERVLTEPGILYVKDETLENA
jgi:hypothetical protein